MYEECRQYHFEQGLCAATCDVMHIALANTDATGGLNGPTV